MSRLVLHSALISPIFSNYKMWQSQYLGNMWLGRMLLGKMWLGKTELGKISDSSFKTFNARLTTIKKNKEDILVCLISFIIE